MRILLVSAWLLAALSASPQLYIFHVETHPQFTWYTQCVTFHSFPSPAWETAYTVFGMVMMYGVPLVAIIFTYTIILLTIYRKSRLANEGKNRTKMKSLHRDCVCEKEKFCPQNNRMREKREDWKKTERRKDPFFIYYCPAFDISELINREANKKDHSCGRELKENNEEKKKLLPTFFAVFAGIERGTSVETFWTLAFVSPQRFSQPAFICLKGFFVRRVCGCVCEFMMKWRTNERPKCKAHMESLYRVFLKHKQ